MTATWNQPLRDGYRALTESAGLVDFSDRSQLEIAGADRAKFLHSFCTNEIRKLAPGAGCEIFILNSQGKILGHGVVFSEPERLLFETVAGEAAKLLAHLDRYVMREDVTLADRSQERAEWLLAGPAAPEVLTAAGVGELPGDPLMSAPATLAETSVWLRRAPLAGPVSFLIDGPREVFAAIGAAIQSAGAKPVDRAAWHARRIEWGWPLFGVDITDKNLPQELNRDRLAISFNKGCYLGQETVARIDALGHVNKLLVGVRWSGDTAPTAGAELTVDDKSAGQVTSASFSPRLDAPLALAYVRRQHATPGAKLTTSAGPAEVVTLPLGE